MRFGILGPLEVLRDGALVNIGAAKQRTLLASLLINVNRVVSTESLAASLWETTRPGSRNVLQNHVMRLRRTLSGVAGRPLIVTRPAGYLLAVPDDAVDIHRFRTLVRDARAAIGIGQSANAADLLNEAIGMWRGDALSDVPSETLRREKQPGLDEERLLAIELRVETWLKLGWFTETIAELTALTALYPLREGLWGQLMLALYRSGRQAEALDAYQRVRGVLATELGTDPSPALQEVHMRILRAEPEALGGPHAPAAITALTIADQPVPRQLPPDTGRLTGRRGQLAMLDRWLDTVARRRAGTPVAAIVGAPGMGKTALAVRWAHRQSERFPDGQLHLDLRGYARSPAVTTTAALYRALIALRVAPERIPADPDARAGLYRSITAGQRLLILLDNARDAGQVRPLLPCGADCLTIVTSRDQLRGLVALDSAYRVTVNALDSDTANELFRELAGACEPVDRTAIDALVGWCAGHPLAIRVLAERASRAPGQLPRLAALLRNERARLDLLLGAGETEGGLRAVFGHSYRALDEPTGRLFQLLAQLMGTTEFTLRQVAGQVGLDQRPAAALLDRLVAAHLLENPLPDRYRYAELVRAYALEPERISQTADEPQ